ncbi:hypothetical protein BM449_01640 [Synechococcus sp. SynAce01]|nr:hypothetical protein BM449_01640 [Synechococcus sp. SynAce01]
MGPETMSQSVAAYGFMNLTFVECLLQGFLNNGWIEMMTTLLAGQLINHASMLRKQPLPFPAG